jgi:hypothetical protein
MKSNERLSAHWRTPTSQVAGTSPPVPVGLQADGSKMNSLLCHKLIGYNPWKHPPVA